MSPSSISQPPKLLLCVMTFSLVILPCYFEAALHAQESGSNASTSIPATIADHAPSRTARLTFVAGSVQVQRSDNTGEESAVLNMPLNEGTRVVTGDYGQAEIEFEDGSVARLTPRSSLALETLAVDAGGSARTRLNMGNGLVYFELRKAAGYSYTVDAAGTSFIPIENATVRVTLDEAPAHIAVLAGSGHIERLNGFRTEMRTGETLTADAKDDNRYFLASSVAEESWDQWNQTRDQMANDEAERRTAARDPYASTQGYGWSDLDSNGSWYDVPGSGTVWQPNVADAGFDPYGYGNWVWSNAGYVWASGYSWGWTPFRCGQWGFYQNFGWGWTPGLGCNQWGFGFGGGGYGYEGGGGFVVFSSVPTRFRPVRIPVRGPGRAHPILAVRGPDGARPPVLRGGPVKLAGSTLQPLRPVNTAGAHAQSTRVQGLLRDAPIDASTREPRLGAVPGTIYAVNTSSGRDRQQLSGSTSNNRVSPGTSVGPAISAGTRAGSDAGRVSASSAQPAPRTTLPPAPRPSPPPTMAAPTRSAPPPSAPSPVRNSAPSSPSAPSAPAPRGK